MSSVENKFFVFITSAGRTGTKFLGDNLAQMIDDCYCVHEPDVLNLDIRNNLRKINKFGAKHMIFDRIRGKSGIRVLSQSLVSGNISENEAWNRILKGRSKYWQSIDNDLIIESYYGWYGLLSAIRNNCPNYKIVIMTRHPGTWIKSNINWGKFYGAEDIVQKIGSKRLNPSMTGDKELYPKWEKMNQFEKLCWTWNAIYSIALEKLDEDPNTMLIKYEDLFDRDSGAGHLDTLVKHITSFSNKSFDHKLKKDILKQRVHQSEDSGFPNFENWSLEMIEVMEAYCGDIMSRLGYSVTKD